MPETESDKIFPTDVLSKRERVERTLNLEPVDRVAIHEQLSWNPGVISMYTGREIEGFNYTYKDICEVIRQTLDTCFQAHDPLGTDLITDEDGFEIQNDNWNWWIAKRPFDDVAGAREYLLRKTDQMQNAEIDDEQVREEFYQRQNELKRLVGGTVIIPGARFGLEECWWALGLTLFSYLYADDPEVVSAYIETYARSEIRRIHAIADRDFSPVACIFADWGTKQGPMFSPEFLHKEHFPYLRQVTETWHSHGIKVLYHNDGNWKKLIPDLVDCEVDGFSCTEPSVGMDIVELKNAWPGHAWMRGIDGVDLMERGTPEQVRREVHRQIEETNALQTGGLLIGTASEINPPIRPENFRAMIEAVGELRNPDFASDK